MTLVLMKDAPAHFIAQTIFNSTAATSDAKQQVQKSRYNCFLSIYEKFETIDTDRQMTEATVNPA
jgi:hypothetical protein